MQGMAHVRRWLRHVCGGLGDGLGGSGEGGADGRGGGAAGGKLGGVNGGSVGGMVAFAMAVLAVLVIAAIAFVCCGARGSYALPCSRIPPMSPRLGGRGSRSAQPVVM